MESIDFTQVALAFGGLLLLLALFYYGARALSGSTARAGKWRSGQRIGVIDSMPVDGTRRLVLVRRDDTEHLLLLGTHGDLVIESNIPMAARGDAELPGAARKAVPVDDSGGWPTLRVPGRDSGRNDTGQNR
jgi:flagellar biogenesis protein FliO